MKRGRFGALALTLLIGGTMGIAAAGQGTLDTTTAAWTDRTRVAAVVTAGTWPTTTASTCIAYGQTGKMIPGCVVSGITYQGWGTAGAQTRNYYINFQTPSDTRSVSFDVDLNTAVGNASSWSWKTAGVLSGAQFTPRDGWTCAQLPRVRGTGADWQTATVYFQVAERIAGAAAVCS